MQPDTDAPRLRLDKWLWAARLYKTRSLAAEQVASGRVTVNDQATKPARELRVGDLVTLRQGPVQRALLVRALSGVRGPAPAAQGLYEETAQSLAERQRIAEARRLAPEPAQTREQGRPTKRDRRELEHAQAPWLRWSVSVDDK